MNMKKIFLLAAMALFTLSANAQTKIGHVNFNELVTLLPEMDNVRETMNAAQKEAEETFQSMYQEYQTKMQQYQQKESTWTAAIKESKGKELADIESRLQEFQQTVSQELQQQQSQLTAPLVQKVQDAVKTVAKSAGVTAVFDTASAIYFDENATVDLMTAARKALSIPDDRTIESLQQQMEAAQQQQQK